MLRYPPGRITDIACLFHFLGRVVYFFFPWWGKFDYPAEAHFYVANMAG